MLIFCTLFDSNYLDKGLALYESLTMVEDRFRLYVFAFDQRAYDVLTDMALDKMRVISLKEFETERMLQVKKERSRAEYCWTCTPITIDYVLSHFNEPHCTYIDADIYFFSSPRVLFDEVVEANGSVIITEHRFPERIAHRMRNRAGKYCVQFNTFINNQNGNEVLSTWKEQCLDWCHYTTSGERMGDQKYLETWTSTYEGVHELENIGGGVAPWNLSQYRLVDKDKRIFEYNNEPFELVFYHFQNIRYLPFGLVNLKSGTHSREIKQLIYFPYLNHIEIIRKRLSNQYSIVFKIKKSTYRNFILRAIQNYIMPFKVRSLSDIVALRAIRRYKA